MVAAICGLGINILKIIGVIILVIIAIILLLLAAILFSPIRYKGYVSKDVPDSKNINYYIKARWLFGIVGAGYDIKGAFVRILGIRINLGGNNKENKKVNNKKTKYNKKNDKRELVEADIEDDFDEFQNEKKLKNKYDTASHKLASTNENNANEINEELDDNYSSEDTNFGDDKADSSKEGSKIELIFYKIKTIIEKIFAIPAKLKEKVNSIINSIKAIKNKINIYIEFYNNNKSGIKEIFKTVKGIIMKLLPKKIKGSVSFGFEDPYKMGQVLSMISIFYCLYAKNIEVKPYFDNGDFVCGYCKLSGKIRIFTILILCIKLYLNDNFKKMYRNYKIMKNN